MRRLPGLPLLLAALGGCAPVFAGAAAPGATLAGDLDAIFDDAQLAHSHWGVLVRSLDTGETLYSRNADRLFVPASNMKIVSGAAALETLGPDYRFVTTLAAGGPIREGALHGPLVVIGTGDPTFSRRFLDDPRDAFRAWADSLRAHGIHRVVGGVVAVDTAFADPPWGQGWMWDDLAGASSAEYGALQFNESVIRMNIFPSGTELQPALISFDPHTQYIPIVNQTRTMPPGSVTAIRIVRDDAGPGIAVYGEIAADSDGLIRTVAVRDQAFYLATVLRETLREQGIMVEGPPSRYNMEFDRYDAAIRDAFPLFVHRSPPLRETLAGMMKPSQNQLAETLLLAVGREAGGGGTARAGIAVADSLFLAWQLENPGYRIVDGSGLSRYNLLSPTFLASLLTRMDRSAYREDWLASMPISGRDGTLASRMREGPLFEQVLAKTGTLTGSRALSGYLTTVRGERIVFSTMVNNHVVTAGDADRIVEAALERIATAR